MKAKAKKKKTAAPAKKKAAKTAAPKRQRKAPAASKPKPRRPGRPTEYTPEVIADIIVRLERYINRTAIPIVAEFAYKNDIPRQALYEHDEFSDSIKRLIDKKEAQLERLMISGIPNVSTGCIFALKQLGWKDRQEVEVIDKTYRVIPAGGSQ